MQSFTRVPLSTVCGVPPLGHHQLCVWAMQGPGDAWPGEMKCVVWGLRATIERW